jgi:hypothetical protein
MTDQNTPNGSDAHPPWVMVEFCIAWELVEALVANGFLDTSETGKATAVGVAYLQALRKLLGLPAQVPHAS